MNIKNHIVNPLEVCYISPIEITEDIGFDSTIFFSILFKNGNKIQIHDFYKSHFETYKDGELKLESEDAYLAWSNKYKGDYINSSELKAQRDALIISAGL